MSTDTVEISPRDQLRVLGQYDLGGWIEAATGGELWSKQREIATELSHRRARIAVPSCNASGKTHLAARLALAFFDAYTPGAPCVQCTAQGSKTGCRGSKVLVTSSKETHLKDNLFGEIRSAFLTLRERGIEIPGNLPPSDTWIEDGPNHLLRGQVATKEESMQGYHAAHKLIIGDEATSVSEDVAKGITSLMATGDTRLLLIFNPTTPETYAAGMTRSPRVKTIRITAYDTPHFTDEHVPLGANLTTPEFLLDLKAQGMGPGSYEWVTRVEAQFWDMGDDTLIPISWIERAENETEHSLERGTALGIDLASYGTAESVIAVRRGHTLVDLIATSAGNIDEYIFKAEDPRSSPVALAVLTHRPFLIVYDADGVGAGAVGSFTRLHEWAKKEGHMHRESQVVGFRGAKGVGDVYHNQRSGWYWALRKRFETGRISIKVLDPKLREQLTQMTYMITQIGKIRLETKDEMKRRGLKSPDRADGVMYAYAFSEQLPDPTEAPEVSWIEQQGFATVQHHHDPGTMTFQQDRPEVNAVTGLPDEL